MADYTDGDDCDFVDGAGGEPKKGAMSSATSFIKNSLLRISKGKSKKKKNKEAGGCSNWNWKQYGKFLKSKYLILFYYDLDNLSSSYPRNQGEAMKHSQTVPQGTHTFQ